VLSSLPVEAGAFTLFLLSENHVSNVHLEIVMIEVHANNPHSMHVALPIFPLFQVLEISDLALSHNSLSLLGVRYIKIALSNFLFLTQRSVPKPKDNTPNDVLG